MEERALLRQGVSVVAGVDEAGSGSWAGPVYAAAVILPLDSRIGLVRDSKTLSASQRDRVATQIRERATAWAVGTASVEEIAALNIRGAGALAMRRAIEALAVPPQFVISDAFRIPGLAVPMKAIIRGDLKVKCVAAASIIAKTSRDAFLQELHAAYPQYGFDQHKGYGTKAHQRALAEHGPCPAHRASYAPIKIILEKQKTAA